MRFFKNLISQFVISNFAERASRAPGLWRDFCKFGINDPHFMQEPYPLYVDEISPDEIKATVSNANSYFANLQVLQSLVPQAQRIVERPETILASIDVYRSYIGRQISGIRILPFGRFICMLTGSAGNRGMVFLDLIGKEELAEKIAEKLGHVDLQERFIEVYEDILDHPENHGKCEWVTGKAGFWSRPGL
jgi:hypothetical protein